MHLSRRRALLAALLLVGLCCVVFAFQAWRAGTALARSRTLAHEVAAHLQAGEVDSARTMLSRLGQQTERAHGDTKGVLWDVASKFPFVGDDVHAFQVAAEAVDEISRTSAPRLLELAQDVRKGVLRPRHGRVDLAAIKERTPAVTKAAAEVHGPAREVAALRADSLVFPLDTMVGELQQQVAQADTALQATATAMTVLPDALGGDGPKKYLLLVHNNAEIRSTGGMPGSWAVLRADHGKVSMGQQGNAADLIDLQHEPFPPTREERLLYGDEITRDLRGAAFTPDFPREAQIAAGMLKIKRDTDVDGVVAVDPIALSQIMSGTGPVKLENGLTITAGNVAQVLLNTIYMTVADSAAQDAFYEAAARNVFKAVVGGQGDQTTVLSGLATAASQGRVLAWAPKGELADALRGSRLEGAVVGNAGRVPQVGIYLNDATASKMQYYLRYATLTRSAGCTADGVQTLHVTTTLRSVAPDSVRNAPVYVTGYGETVRHRGDMAMNLRYYAPYKGVVESMKVDGRAVTVQGGSYKGRQVAVWPIRLKPGQTTVVDTVITTGPGQTHDAEIFSTPGMEVTANPVTARSSCAS